MDDKNKRRTFLKTAGGVSLLAGLTALNPIKLLSKKRKKKAVKEDNLKVTVHPLAVKRSKRI